MLPLLTCLSNGYRLFYFKLAFFPSCSTLLYLRGLFASVTQLVELLLQVKDSLPLTPAAYSISIKRSISVPQIIGIDDAKSLFPHTL